jgi:two-component system chemotaxis response regulator CheY
MATILTVDDTASMRQMVSYTLTDAGYEVEQASDGQQALDICQKKKFDLIIADINMPVMDGITLVKKLRESSDYKFTPILMLTTESQDDKRQEGKAAGATGWIVKPFNPDQLTNVVKNVLG